MLTCESSCGLESFCEKYRAVGIKLFSVMYLFRRKTETRLLKKLKPCMTPSYADVAYSYLHPRQFCMLLVAWWDRALLLFLPFYLLAQEQQTSPCRRNKIWRESWHCISLGVWTFYTCKTCNVLYLSGRKLLPPQTPVLAGQSAPASLPFSWGLCVVMQHPATPVFSEVNLGRVRFSYC